MKKLNIIIISLVLTLSLSAGPKVDNKCFEKLPFGCFVTKSVVVPKGQTDVIAKRLGVPLKSLSNTFLLVQGRPIQVNILEASNVRDAKKLYQTVSGMKNHPAFCLLQGKKVVEFCKADATAATKTAYELGLVKKPKKIRYKIAAHLATIDKSDYMAFNRLSNAFFKTNIRNPSQDSIEQISALSKGFTFGNSLALYSRKEDSYDVTPKAVKTVLENGLLTYSFKSTPKAIGVPYVTFKAEVLCNGTGFSPKNREADNSLLSPTSFWPVDDPEIQELAKKITSEQKTQEEKVQAILEWLTPGKNIKSDGPTGSRWGVKKVLKQKYGHCWDSSDCFVTLARAAGIPCRQVGGWLYGTSGHIWAEVLIEGKGWQQVDPTGGGKLNCGIYHIPYFVTETGEMPILYLSFPQIDIAETE